MRQTHLSTLAGSIFLAASPVLAQTAAPGTAPAATADGGSGWIWIVVLLLVLAAVAWYFMRGRSSRTGMGSTTSSVGVDHDRVSGSAKSTMGSVKEGAGKVLGDTKLQAEGKMDKAEGRVQNTFGGAKDTLRE